MDTSIYGSSANDGLFKARGPFRIFQTGEQQKPLMIIPSITSGCPQSNGKVYQLCKPTYSETELIAEAK